jgi:DNA-binding MarR family transcriptional regulator
VAVCSINPIVAIHRTHNILRRCEDKIFAQHGLTTEQYEVLLAIKCLDAPVRITDIAVRLIRSTNSISMIVDRMVKAGLLNRVRDEGDRREVHVTITDRAEEALKLAILAGQTFIQETLSALSYSDKEHLLTILEEVARATREKETTGERTAATVS